MGCIGEILYGLRWPILIGLVLALPAGYILPRLTPEMWGLLFGGAAICYGIFAVMLAWAGFEEAAENERRKK